MLDSAAEIKTRLHAQALALVEKAAGERDEALLEALLEVCEFLENSADSPSPIVAVEREVHSMTGAYHLAVRRLSSSIPAGKFQILMTRSLASGLIY